MQLRTTTRKLKSFAMRSQKGKVTLKKEYKRESTILSIIPPEVGSSSFMVLFTFVTIVTQI